MWSSALWLLLVLPSLVSSLSLTPDGALEMATDLYNQGDAKGAQDLLHLVTEASPDDHRPYFYLAAINQHLGHQSIAERLYLKCLSLSPPSDHTRADALNNLGKVYADFGTPENVEKSYRFYKQAVDEYPEHVQSRINLGLHYHAHGEYRLAVDQYVAAASSPDDAQMDEVHYNMAVSYSHMGMVLEAVDHYRQAIACRLSDPSKPAFSEAWLNLAALHHKHGSVPDAVWHYNRTIEALLDPEAATELRRTMPAMSTAVYRPLATDPFVSEMLVMVLNNMGQALSQMGRVLESKSHHIAAGHVLRSRIEILQNRGTQESRDESHGLSDDLLHTRTHIFRSEKASCDWSGWPSFPQLHADVNRLQMDVGAQSALLPFDTLGLPVKPEWRRRVAVQHAQLLSDFADRIPLPDPPLDPGGKLKLGYICYDFNDHPTAHLAEGLFLHHNLTGRVTVDAYNYGKNDNSTYRKNIVSLVGGDESSGGSFIELSPLGHDEAASRARSRSPHILIDMQGFTLGGRPEITARRVAPIQVNYLIFPGTSGASFMDYIVGDRHVTPPEHQEYYTEKLALMPDSYQINYYDRHVSPGWSPVDRDSPEWRAGRAAEGLDAGSFVFANFNKQDKIEPEIYSVWMSILQRVPGSTLWLLEPSHRYRGSGIISNLRAEAEARGVRGDRVVFAGRVPKGEHLQRVALADLFLDSFLYGAHSTATDALRGGLPVMTVGGGEFPRRVGISLLETLGGMTGRYLLASTTKEFVENSVLLSTTDAGAKTLAMIRGELNGRSKLFDTTLYTRNFEKLCMAMWDAGVALYEEDEDDTTMHIIAV